MNFAITKMPRCRWCGREPEFEATVVTARVCEHCGAMQDAVISLSGPGGKPVLKFFVNPDDSLFFEVEKAEPDETVRYTLSPAALAKAGVPTQRSPKPLNGRSVDKGF